jgi:tetratricopeptide (TPR) repeat protein
VINFSVVRMIIALQNDPIGQARRLVDIAGRIVDRDRMRDIPRQYAARAHRVLPDRREAWPLWGEAWTVLGRASMRQGDADSAIVRIERGLPFVPADRRKAPLFTLGSAYAAKGDYPRAIDGFVRSLVAEPASDTSAAIVLRNAWLHEHDSLEGLDERIAQARAGRN